jgi:lauroyl/myristoyl acyltransferase
MAKSLLQIAGWLIARTPEFILRGSSVMLGTLIYVAAGRRRQVMLRNLAAVFPDRSERWRRRLARESCHRMVETGLLAAAAPHLSATRVRRLARLAPEAVTYFAEAHAQPRPIVIVSAHLAYWEALSWVPELSPAPLREPATIYRPLRNPALNAWVVRTRSRFGVKLLSRRTGIHDAVHILNRQGCINVLFDQNAGGHGTLTTFFGRRISMTELPALLVQRTGADLVLVGTRRTGLWRTEIFLHRLSHDGTTAGILAAINLDFEHLLRTDEGVCASWLWLHDRWKINELPVELAKITAKRNLLEEDARFRSAAGRS